MYFIRYINTMLHQHYVTSILCLLLCKQISFIHYAKAAEIKNGINDQFSETFPHVKITLSKLRRMKKDIYNIARDVSLPSSLVVQ